MLSSSSYFIIDSPTFSLYVKPLPDVYVEHHFLKPGTTFPFDASMKFKMLRLNLLFERERNDILQQNKVLVLDG